MAVSTSVSTAPRHSILNPTSPLMAMFPEAWNDHFSSVSLFNPPLMLQLMLRTNFSLNPSDTIPGHTKLSICNPLPPACLAPALLQLQNQSHLPLFCIYGKELVSWKNYSDCHPIPNPHHTIKGQNLHDSQHYMGTNLKLGKTCGIAPFWDSRREKTQLSSLGSPTVRLPWVLPRYYTTTLNHRPDGVLKSISLLAL